MTVNRTFHNTTWTVSKTARLADVTDSASQGHEKRKRIIKGGTFKFEWIWDSANIPDRDLTLDAGDEGTIRFKLGTTGKFYRAPIIVETFELVNSQVDVIKGSCSGFLNGPVVNPVAGVSTAP